jgi:hypothetical protein
MRIRLDVVESEASGARDHLVGRRGIPLHIHSWSLKHYEGSSNCD